MASRPASTGPLALLTVAQAAGQAGTWAAYTAALPIALAHAHPAAALSTVTAAWGIPSAAARLAGGAVDRYGPRGTGAAAWTLAALAAAVAAVTHPGLPGLLALLAVTSAGGTWGVSAGEAAPTWLPGRPDPAAAGSWLVIAGSLPLALGPAGAANLATYASDRAAWALVAALSAVAAVVTLAVPATRPPATPQAQQRRGVPAPVLAVFAATVAVYVTFGVITILEPLYVRQVLADPLTVYGWLLATWSAAGIVAALIAGRWSRLTSGRWSVPAAAAITAAGIAAYVSTPLPAVAFTGAALFGSGAALFRISARAVLVATIPPHEHGRVLSLWESVQCAAFVAPTAVTGSLVALLGLRAVLACCSSLAAAIAAFSAITGAIPPPRTAVQEPDLRRTPLAIIHPHTTDHD
ncbi:MAG TPA: MFS transporter [Streptosporangiaceae bacterium]|jgi:MFS family permease|nr:MFS transporter [Streptosporangiaceae bacterium]